MAGGGGAQEAPLVLVRGSSDVGSAVAHALFCAGYSVAIHDSPQPAATRRMMAFTDALFDGSARLAGIEARRLDDLPEFCRCLQKRHAIPVTTLELPRLLEFLRPAVVVDARVRKRQTPEDQRGLAPLVIGLGPNCSVDANVDLAVETAWGEALGRVVGNGATLPLSGEPRPISGCARERYVYAPQAGTFITGLEVGDAVEQDQPVAHIGSEILFAPLSGRLRGLTRSGVTVATGTKVIEVDPRGPDAQISGIGERPGRIASGVLLALRRRGVLPLAMSAAG